jgi:uncharacterized protein YycO
MWAKLKKVSWFYSFNYKNPCHTRIDKFFHLWALLKVSWFYSFNYKNPCHTRIDKFRHLWALLKVSWFYSFNYKNPCHTKIDKFRHLWALLVSPLARVDAKTIPKCSAQLAAQKGDD